ncbi:MAG: MBL fold metallo-hydrolase, partial [Lachnospiraceae bacterium]|nr:MBL fold metallo-hydrolase [Lachnospiraceae bacterium]
MEKVTEDIVNIGVNDREITLFEGQYKVKKGMAYNSYVILDEQVVVMDTVDPRATAEWLKNLEEALGTRKVDYLVIQHMEPDHGGSIMQLIGRFPDMKLVGNAKTFQMLQQFFDVSPEDKAITVKEGDTLSVGKHTLQFFMAPMVHWPEVMVTYEQSKNIFFSADGFGKFGTRDADEDWADEARRYYINICGKYGMQVQALLKKAATLEINTICPLHGPVLSENLEYYINKYQIWS